MARTKLKSPIVVGAGVLLAAGIAIVSLRSPDPLAARVEQILRQDMMPGKNNWKAGMDELWALGPGIIPHLAAEARLPDSFLSKNYPGLWKKFPPLLQHYLPQPIDRGELRQAAMHAIAEFGPQAVRRAAPQVIAGLGETDDRFNNYAVGCVRWLLPESSTALASFKQGLTGANTNWSVPAAFLGRVGDDSVWAKIPGLVPLLTNHLGDAGQAYLAAIALGRVGSNAAAALPALIQTADLGAAGSFPDAEAARMHPAEVYSNPIGWHTAKLRQDDKGMNHNRAMAALALGRIGIPTPEVRAALVRAWNAPDGWVRHNAALAVALVGPPMTNDLRGLLTGLMDPDNSALESKLLAVGKIGPGARDAIETLRELMQTNRLRSLVTDPEAKVVGWSIEDLAVSAKMAICRIDPQEGRPYLPDIANKIG